MTRRRAARRETLVAYARLPHATPIIAVLATTLAMTFVVEADVSAARRILILVAMLGAQVVLGVANELLDFETDRVTKPDKPLVSGRVSRRGALGMLAGGLVLMHAGAIPLGWRSYALCVLGCAIGVAYSVWFKRTRFAWLPYIAALPLLPIWVATSLHAFDARLLWLYPLGALAVAGVQFAQSAPDIEADRRAGIASLTTELGQRRTLVASWLATIASAGLVGLLGRSHAATLLAAGVVVAAVAANAAIDRADPERGVRLAFPIAAASAGLLGVAWVYASGR